MMQKQELLAPAGDVNAGYAALHYGADAVYLGLARFSARATATNFDEPTLDEFTAFAHSLQRKVYVAVNTVLQESELSGLIECLDICSRCKVDGVIIQDLGVARVVKNSYPQLEMHASTQMAVHNKEGALFLQKLGFKRVVLARELTKVEIKEIAAIKDLETEAFIHGALCYSYSGLCQFSALEYGRSANRGKCLYPCRAAFACDSKKEHLFSMKDMALEQDVLKMPVTSLKIEGRKKTALYVAAVTDYYRRILDNKSADMLRAENIKQIFSRPWCKFHFNGANKDIIDRNFVGHRGLKIGQIEKIAHGCIVFKTSHKIARYDGLQIDVADMEKPFGFSVQKLYVNQRACLAANAGEVVSIKLPPDYPCLHLNDNIYLASASEVKGSYHYNIPKPHSFSHTHDIAVLINISKSNIQAMFDKFKVEIKGQFAPAQNLSLVQEAIERAFAKTGGTNFSLKELKIENPQHLFVPASMLNELRRKLYAAINFEHKSGVLPQVEVKKPQPENTAGAYKIKVDDLAYLEGLNLASFAEIIWLIKPNSDITPLALLPHDKIRIALPEICRKPALYAPIVQELLTKGYHKWEVGNYWGLEFLAKKDLDISLNSFLYMLNSQATALAKEMGVSQVTLSIEDTKENIRSLILHSALPTTLVIYQDAPLFTSVGCIRDNDCRHCLSKEKWFELENKGKHFKALSRDCQTMVFDKYPFCIAQDAADLRPDYLRLDFCYCRYKAQEVAKICAQILEQCDVNPCIKGNFSAHNI